MSLFGTILAIVLAFLLGGAVAFYTIRARAREGAALPDAADAPLAQEVRAIGSQIEHAMAEQRLQGETQRQLLAQKLDGVRQTVDAQGAHVDGLRSELRHEIQRRDQEMAEIRAQLSSSDPSRALAAGPAAALPPADAARFEDEWDASPMTDEASSSEPSPAEAESYDDAAYAEPAFEDISFASESEDAPAEEIAFEEFTFSTSSAQAAPPVAAEPPAPASTGGSMFEDVFATSADESGDGVGSPSGFESWSPTRAEAAPAFLDEHPASVVSESETIATATAPDASAFSEVALDIFAADEALPEPDAEPASAPSPLSETAWVARPDRPEPVRMDAPEEAIIADDLIQFDPATLAAPSEEATPVAETHAHEPATGLIDLDALVAASAPAPVAAPASAEPEPVAEPLAVPVAEPTPQAAPTPMPAVAEETAPEPEPEVEDTYTPPEGAEDLTVVSSIDEDVQRLLYLAGVTSLEEIAQWSPTEARRIGAQVSVSEATIMNQWVFEAQAALFNRYAQRAGR